MSFVPEGQKGLLLRTPLTYGFTAPKAFTQPKAIYSKVQKIFVKPRFMYTQYTRCILVRFYFYYLFLLCCEILLQEDAKIHVLGQKDQDILMKNKMDSLAFYTRNNPHPCKLNLRKQQMLE